MFTRWLHREAKGTEPVQWILLVIVLNFLYAVFICKTLSRLEMLPYSEPLGLTILSPSFPFVLFGLALLEEIVFRLPLALFISADESLRAILGFAIILSVSFGLAHGYLTCVLMQGVVGLNLCLLFLKCGGLKGNYTKALLSSATAHFLFNLNVAGLRLLSDNDIF